MLGPGYTLFAAPAARVGQRGLESESVPVVTRRLPAIAARALGLGADGTVLVRPDGVPERAEPALRAAA